MSFSSVTVRALPSAMVFRDTVLSTEQVLSHLRLLADVQPTSGTESFTKFSETKCDQSW